jgi:phosphatidylcholine synthase
VLALAATFAVFEGRFREAFLWLGAACFIDTTDGWLARGLRVTQRLPGYDGARLDDIVDYLTYVFVPVLLIVRADLLPASAGTAVAALVLLASAYGFGQVEAKVATTDHFFTGFPSYWNIVALYLYVWRLPASMNAALLTALALLVFVPIRYVYPSRTVTLKVPTLMLGTLWAVLVIVAVWRLPATDGPWLTLSLVFVVYYGVLSLYLHARGSSATPAR